MIEAGTPPEKILGLLGITEPEDLDIEAIAYACGATIVAIEPIVEAWNANHGVIDEDEQFFFAVVRRNRGRDIELDRGVVRIRFVE